MKTTLIALLFFALTVFSASASIMLTQVATPPGSFNTTQTTSNVTVANGEVLLVAYGDDDNGSFTSITFDGSGLEDLYSSVNGRTDNYAGMFANDTGSDVTADVVVTSTNDYMYGIYTLSNVDLDVAPVIFPGSTGGSGGAETLDISATGLEAGQFVLTSVSNGSGSTTISVSPGSTFHQASTANSSGGDFAAGTFEVLADGNQDFTWTSSGDPFRVAGGAAVFTAIPEPSTISLLTVGLFALACRRRRR